MVNIIPQSWSYSSDIENLFLFYQCSEELLSYSTPDTFRLPVCNSMALCHEIRRIYKFLYDRKQIDKYYKKYIPCIIDELIKAIGEDAILKQKLGQRLDRIKSGLISAKSAPTELLRWINLIVQSCTTEQHASICKDKIIDSILSGRNKSKLMWCTQNYYIDLINLGYSSEYLYQTVIRYFDNREKIITKPEDILPFFDNFDYNYNTYEFYIVADTYKLDNLSKIYPQFGKNIKIKELEKSDIRVLTSTSRCIQRFYEKYEQLQNNGYANIKMLSCQSEDLDPYSAFENISQVFDLAQCFEGYFKHRSERKLVFDILLNNNGHYFPIRPRKTIPSRPYLDQNVINRRMEAILSPDACSIDVTLSLLKAIDMHLDALNCKNAETMLRTFWIALETLFFDSDETSERESAKYCLLNIVQKTYMLKQFRLIYDQMINAITDNNFWDEIGISNFKQFINVFMSTTVDEEGFKKFTSALANNPLLRSRIYWFRKSLSDSKSIRDKIEDHRQKVSWHIDRIYRTRNLSTHAGISMPYVDEILFNIHNYFDYVVNYIICKLENYDYIHSISATVFEAKIDNEIHMAFLKKIKEINKNNYLYSLFGPDSKIINYNFEVIIDKDNS